MSVLGLTCIIAVVIALAIVIIYLMIEYVPEWVFIMLIPVVLLFALSYLIATAILGA